MNKIVEKWQQFCDGHGLTREAAAARLGLPWYDYLFMIQGKREFPESILYKMSKIIEGQSLLDGTILPTALHNEFEKLILHAMQDKQMLTLSAPTGAGKTTVAKSLAYKHNAKYIQILSELEKPKTAARKNFVRELLKLYGLNDRSVNNLRHLINMLQTDTRSLLIIDEAQRLLTEDWGYFKVLQDIFDNIPSLSIVLLGNYRFYDSMFIPSQLTYSGVLDEEQCLRRMTKVIKLPRLQASDVRLWSDYHGIKLNKNEYNQLAEFFSMRAGLADLENVRKEIIRVMGRGKIKEYADVDAATIITVYKGIHTKIREVGFEEEAPQKSAFSA